RPARAVRPLGRGVPAVPPVGEGRAVAGPVRPTAGGPPGRPYRVLRQLGGAGAPARRRGAEKKGGQQAQALGRSRGGFGTKVHLPAADGRPALGVVLPRGRAGAAPQSPELTAGVPEEGRVGAAGADRSYDSDAIRADLKGRGIEAVIPPLACR